MGEIFGQGLILEKKNWILEHINYPRQIAIAVNPKEYIEKSESDETNKKHKGLKKGSKGMEIKSFCKRKNSAKDIEKFGQLPKENVTQYRFPVKQNEMLLQEVKKSKFPQINDKRYCFSNGLVSLTFSHFEGNS